MSDRILRTTLGAVLFVGVMAGCGEQVTASLGCPALCVDESASLRDTILLGAVVLDSSIFGFPHIGETRDLTLINQGDTADVRIIARYDSLPVRYQIPLATSDSLIRRVDSATMIFVIDTLTTRITTPITIDAFDVDTTADDTIPKALIGLFRANRLLGSQTFQPTDVKDTLRLPLDNAALFAKVRDTLRLRIGLRIRSGAQSKLTITGNTFVPRIRMRVSTDTTVAPDTITPRSKTPADNVYLQSVLPFYRLVVAGALPPPPPGRFVIGGLAGARTYLRFDVPTTVVDSVQVIRASLLLTQTRARSLGNLRDSIYVLTHPVLASPSITDITTAASFIGPASAFGVDSVLFAPGDSGVRSIELVNVLRAWRLAGTANSSRSIVLRSAKEGLTSSELSFFSMEAPLAQRPRLRITYVPRRGFGIP